MKNENDSRDPMARIVRQGSNHFWELDAKESDNPYAPGTAKNRAWTEGWHLARLELNIKATKKGS